MAGISILSVDALPGIHYHIAGPAVPMPRVGPSGIRFTLSSEVIMQKTAARIVGSCILLFLASCHTLPAEPENDKVQVSLTQVSDYLWAGGDNAFRLTVHSESGKGLRCDLLDRSHLRVKLAEGRVLAPASEGIAPDRLALGDRATLSRTVLLRDLLQGLETQTVEVWWEDGGLHTEPVTARIYAWDLRDIQAVMETDMGEIVFEFFPGKAPLTVQNFVDLVLKGFYDGLTFHRIVPGFMIQGGCPHGDGTGDPGYTLPGEFSDISHVRGILSMARSADPDSAGCQFFIMHGDNPYLDGQYAAFGRVVSGMDTVDRIAAVETVTQRFVEEKSRPVEAPRIRKITLREKSDKKKPAP
jgi:peptidyl-prolyl cis-trans isomerase B (cyclophilin B)